MFNIYCFLYSTLSLTILAAFLLLLKRILQDKLSPRWQYGVWAVLALRFVLPLTGTGRELTSVLQLFIETIKGIVESGRNSAYTQVADITRTQFPFPWQKAMPASITDWLFLLYSAGVALTLLWYLISYIRLRLLLKHGRPAPQEVLAKAEIVCEAHRLDSCRILQVEGLPSAFICGVFKPILAIPTGAVPEESVILHELLHLRHQDALQNIFWSFVKAVHWCNPILRCVCRRIGNDLESLCDQRVLERLDGEARREYGRTLLSMANERYPRAPGTTSLSNGGAFIAKRIEAIARFKQYPQGMSVVSICLCVLLAVTFFYGNVSQSTLYDSGRYLYGGNFEQNITYASARLYRSTTLAGALDTYAKGLINENRLYVAAASPLERQAEVLLGDAAPWMEQNDWQDPGSGAGYQIYNLSQGSDGSYSGLLLYEIGPAPEDPPPPENTRLDWYAIYPLRAWEQDGRWAVEPAAEPYRQAVTANDLSQLPWLTEYRAEGESGTVSIALQLRAYVDNTETPDNLFGSMGISVFDHSLDPAAEFDNIVLMKHDTYTCTEDRYGLTDVAIKIQTRFKADEELLFDDHIEKGLYIVSSSTDGTSSIIRSVDADWDGTLVGGSGIGHLEDFQEHLPYDFVVRVYWNGEAVEDLYLKEVQE